MIFSIAKNKTRHSALWQSVVMLSVMNKPFVLSAVMLNVIMLGDGGDPKAPGPSWCAGCGRWNRSF
jgi:hypothetical protein